jgi:iron-sulfur cluster assembly protein
LVTPDAGVKIKELIQREEKGDYLRIKITGGGCNGLSYKMKFVDQGKDKDILVESAGQSVLVDSKTALYLRGTTLDYSNKLVGGGFKFSNPMLRQVAVAAKALIYEIMTRKSACNGA